MHSKLLPSAIKISLFIWPVTLYFTFFTITLLFITNVLILVRYLLKKY